jgi:hypothetical protein
MSGEATRIAARGEKLNPKGDFRFFAAKKAFPESADALGGKESLNPGDRRFPGWVQTVANAGDWGKCGTAGRVFHLEKSTERVRLPFAEVFDGTE